MKYVNMVTFARSIFFIFLTKKRPFALNIRKNATHLHYNTSLFKRL